MFLKEWIPYKPEQFQAIHDLAQRLNLTFDNDSFSFLHERYYGLTSYTLRDSLDLFKRYLMGNRINYYSSEDDAKIGMLEGYLLAIISGFSPVIRNTLARAFDFRDRGGTDRRDPLDDEDLFRIAYLPKGITDFVPRSPCTELNIDLTAQVQREIIKENNADDTLETQSPDKTITIKIITDTLRPDFMHIYLNKKLPQTIRRIIYKSLNIYFHTSPTVLNSLEESEKNTFFTLIENFFEPNEHSLDIIIEVLRAYIEEHLKIQEENLIRDFSKEKQTAMNDVRKRALENKYHSAKDNYERNLRQYTEFKKEYITCKKDYDNYEEVPFDSIEVFLTKIKEYPRTKFFGKVQRDNLQFLIEEPLIHTEGETWAKYLTNVNSELNSRLDYFASNNYNYFGTTEDILKYAAARLFKELFVDQKIRLYTSAMLGLSSNDTEFRINKYHIDDDNYFPHPHIGRNSLTCWGEAVRAITNEILENDGETAFLQLTYALQQMTASDTAVARMLTEQILDAKYFDLPVYLKKEATTRTTFKEIIKEFVADETNKINNIIDSEG